MKSNVVKRALRAGEPQVGTWLSLGSPHAARFAAHAGLSWLTVDMEHAPVDLNTAALMFGAIADAGCVALARVPTGRHDWIKQVLDAGAMGIVAPMVMTADEARAIVAATQYPPRGNRSVGGSHHALNFGTDAATYFARADDELLVVIQIEHIDAVERADAICAVPGIDAVFVGPNDLAASMRLADGTPPDRSRFEAALRQVREACARHKVAAGLHVPTAQEATARIAEGWRFVAVASELKFMLDGMTSVVRAVDPAKAGAEVARY